MVYFHYESLGKHPYMRHLDMKHGSMIPSKLEWDLTNGPLSRLLELLDTQVSGSVQWVLLEFSWNDVCLKSISIVWRPGDVSWTHFILKILPP